MWWRTMLKGYLELVEEEQSCWCFGVVLACVWIAVVWIIVQRPLFCTHWTPCPWLSWTLLFLAMVELLSTKFKFCGLQQLPLFESHFLRHSPDHSCSFLDACCWTNDSYPFSMLPGGVPETDATESDWGLHLVWLVNLLAKQHFQTLPIEHMCLYHDWPPVAIPYSNHTKVGMHLPLDDRYHPDKSVFQPPCVLELLSFFVVPDVKQGLIKLLLDSCHSWKRKYSSLPDPPARGNVLNTISVELWSYWLAVVSSL